MKQLITITIGTTVLLILFKLVPFTISLPIGLYTFLTGGSVKRVFDFIYYFIPLDFLVSCLITIYIFKYSGLFIKMISWIYHKIF